MAQPESLGPFRIQAAATLSGVPAATLRAWERRYGVPVPRRTATAYRLYSSSDVDLIRRMADLVDGGLAPAEAAQAVLAAAPPVEASDGETSGGLELAQQRLLSATQRWDSAALDAELLRLTMLLDPHTLYERVLSPVLVEAGERWAAGTLSVAQEHLLSNRVEMTLRASLRGLERAEGPLALLACVDEEQHVLGLLGAALRFAASGARVLVLGARTPPEAVADTVRSTAPRLVGLSASLVPPGGGKALVRAYARACGDTPWLLGGPAAEGLAGVVQAAGGTPVVGAVSGWGYQIRDWLRGPR